MRFNHLRDTRKPTIRLLIASVPLMLMTAMMLVGVIGAHAAADVHSAEVVATTPPVAIDVAIVPDASTMALLGLGTGLLLARRLFGMHKAGC